MDVYSEHFLFFRKGGFTVFDPNSCVNRAELEEATPLMTGDTTDAATWGDDVVEL